MIALAYLSPEIKLLLTALAWSAFLPDRPTGLTFEVFLAALCEAHPQEMSGQFRNPKRIEHLIRKYKPYPLRHIGPEELGNLIRERATAAGVELPSGPSGTLPAFSIKMEPRLVAIFEEAVRLAQQAHLHRAGIPQFVKAFASDEALLTKLYSETGLILRTDDRS